MAYSNRFPLYVAFAMTKRDPAGIGGETTVCDNLEVLSNLTPGTVKKMRSLGMLCIR
jgi:hypothetical protein